MSNPSDRTSNIERDVLNERAPRFKHVARLFAYIFSSAKIISCIYLGAFILLSLLRPVLALIWGRYIETAQALSPDTGLFAAIGLLLAYFAINFVCEMLDRYLMRTEQIERLDVVQANRQRELFHSKIFQKLAGLSPEYLEIPKINDNIEQIFKFFDDDYSGVTRSVMLQSYIVIAKAVSVISIAAALYVFSPVLCVIVLVAPLPTLYSLTLGQKMRFRFVKSNMTLERRAEYFQNLMLSQAGKELKTLGLHDFFYSKWKSAADEYTVKEMRLIRTEALLQTANYSLLSLANVGGSVFAVVLMAQGRISLGALGAVLALVSTLVTDTKAMLAGFATALTKKNEAAQFFDLLELASREENGETSVQTPRFENLEVKNVSYRYPMTDKYVLDNINFSINCGEKVAFVGENGMGKTTLIKLITGTLAPSSGEITVNGEPLRSIAGALSAVTQQPAQYVTFTVGDNVFLGDTALPRDEKRIGAALEFSGLGEIDRDEKLGKDVGGTELSGGQWQKLAIARAHYRGRDLIILDEPTSNLDPLAETEIFKKYIEMSADKTVIFITHRISVAALASRVVVFDRGKIVQDGAPQALAAQDGEYSRLFAEQAKWYDR